MFSRITTAYWYALDSPYSSSLLSLLPSAVVHPILITDTFLSPGAVIGWLIFSTTAATSVCGVCLSALAAMMVYLSLVTLLPISLNVASSTHNSGIFKSSHSSLLVSVFVFIGMLVSAVVLLIVEYAG